MLLYDANYSTNAERVAIALGLKGLRAERRTISYGDRSPVIEVSGQPLVPVLVHDDGTVVSDSTRIIEDLDARFPDPPLFPADRAERARMALFVDWFNRVWKVAPNAIADDPSADVDALAADMARHLAWFDDLLEGRDFLWGDRPSAADCSAYPFVRYALGKDDADDERFHEVCVEHQRDPGPSVVAWIRRCDALPRG